MIDVAGGADDGVEDLGRRFYNDWHAAPLATALRTASISSGNSPSCTVLISKTRARS